MRDVIIYALCVCMCEREGILIAHNDFKFAVQPRLPSNRTQATPRVEKSKNSNMNVGGITVEIKIK